MNQDKLESRSRIIATRAGSETILCMSHSAGSTGSPVAGSRGGKRTASGEQVLPGANLGRGRGGLAKRGEYGYSSRITADLDGEDRSELLKAIANPAFAMFVVVAGDGIDAAEKGSANAAGDAMIDADLVTGHDLATRVGWHRGAFRFRVH